MLNQTRYHEGITLSPSMLAAFCQTHHIARLALFGSAIRGELTPESDIDLLIEFEAGHPPGWEFFTLQDELAVLFGRKVDLSTFEGIKGAAGKQIRDQARMLYDAR